MTARVVSDYETDTASTGVVFPAKILGDNLSCNFVNSTIADLVKNTSRSGQIITTRNHQIHNFFGLMAGKKGKI